MGLIAAVRWSYAGKSHAVSWQSSTAANKNAPRSRWLVSVSQRRHRNIAAVAMANKNARIAWALLTHGKYYDSQHGRRSSGQYGAVDNSAAQALQNV
jgi:hypothetical protein